jgi:farnesyl diphosphate synthase/geranylgeranyl diphosphate synthase type II
MFDFGQYLQQCRSEVEQDMLALFDTLEQDPPELHQALRYSCLNGGKRVRPLLVYAAAKAVNPGLTDRTLVKACAVAIELIHSYSLIHDDLPAMDDDRLRRGQPTCHIQFNEATAILAGDALQPLAFQTLAQASEAAPGRAIELIKQLSLAAGAEGMVAGQAIDLEAVDQQLNIQQLEHMHSLKTGKLIKAAVAMGAIAGGCSNTQSLHDLDCYASAIGLAFQVQDDILDVTASTETLGKQQGADAALNKPTYVSLLGLDAAKAKAHTLHHSALSALQDFDQSADPLRELSAYIIERLN